MGRMETQEITIILTRSALDSKSINLVTLCATAKGVDMMEDMQKKLVFAGNEQLRMEDEGGTPLTRAQAIKVEACYKASRCISDLLLAGHSPQPPLFTHPLLVAC
jgi:hypothetical protein